MADKCQQCGEVEYTWQYQGKVWVQEPFKPDPGVKAFTCCRCITAEVSAQQEEQEEEPIEQPCNRPTLRRRAL